MTITQTAMHEPTAWLRRTIARRLAEIDQVKPSGIVALAPLGEPTGPGKQEDRTCDRCRTYVWRDTLYCTAIRPRADVVLILGLCAHCARREGWDTE